MYTCLARAHIQSLKSSWIVHAEAEVEPRLKFKPRLNYGWFHLNLYLTFQNLGQRSIKTGFGDFETWLNSNTGEKYHNLKTRKNTESKIFLNFTQKCIKYALYNNNYNAGFVITVTPITNPIGK